MRNHAACMLFVVQEGRESLLVDLQQVFHTIAELCHRYAKQTWPWVQIPACMSPVALVGRESRFADLHQIHTVLLGDAIGMQEQIGHGCRFKKPLGCGMAHIIDLQSKILHAFNPVLKK